MESKTMTDLKSNISETTSHKGNLNSHSQNQLLNFLKHEVNRRNDLKVIKEKVESLELGKNKSKETDYNMIYRFKLEKTKGDSLFSSVNDSSRHVGSTLGVRTTAYLEHVSRYNMSKSLVLNATEYERNWIRNFTNFVVNKAWRHKANYSVKLGLATMFLYNLCLANENLSLYRLRRPVATTTGDVLRIYYNSGITFVMAFLAFVYI